MNKLLCALLLFPACVLAAQPIPKADAARDILSAHDADFLAARDAFRAGNLVRFEDAAARLPDTPLEPYLAYYRLRMNLETADPSSIRTYLARTDDTPIIDRLRGEWLKQLGKNQQWNEFLAEYPRLVRGDVELTCYALQARAAKNEEAVHNEARDLWLASDKEQAASCAPPFEAAIAAGVISEEDIWRRVGMAMQAGRVSLASQLAAKLPPDRALPSAALTTARSKPERFLNNFKPQQANAGQRRMVLYALQRMARSQPQAAYARWKSIAAHFPPDEQRYFYSWLGYEAARKQDVRALEWYAAADDAPLSEEQMAWRARAALRVQNWPEVLASIGKMSSQQQQDVTWRYWRARALQAQGHKEEAESLFHALSSDANFYGLLAAEEIGISRSNPFAVYYQPSDEELNAMRSRPGVQRTIALYRLDLRAEAFREWAWAVRNFDDKQLLAAAEVARRNGMYDRAINTAERTARLHDFNLRYLSPYRDLLRKHIQQNELEEAWVYGLMRQESRFVARAKSSAGAAGIMQVMPATATWIARRMGLTDYRHASIHDVDTNLKLGTYYMKTVLDWLDDNPALASAAYNAGPSRARQWRADTPLEGAIYVETIPFDETRDYVKKVLSNTMYYAQMFGHSPHTLKQRLGVVAPKNSLGSQPVPDER